MDFEGDGDNPFAVGKEKRAKTEGFPHIKARLKKRGEQAKLAKALDISEGWLSQILSGKRGTSNSLENRMAKYFGTTRDGLRRPAEHPDLRDFIARLPQGQHRRALRVLQSAFADDD